MKRKRFLAALILLWTAMLTGCACQHTSWQEATCVTPKTCVQCGETEGASLGHDWTAATCQTLSCCSRCGETQGTLQAHSWYQDLCGTRCFSCGIYQEGTQVHSWCTDPCSTRCLSCGIYQEGSEITHEWEPANCTSPAMCVWCGATEGEPNDEHRWRGATTEEPETCIYCGLTQGEKLQIDDRYHTDACRPIIATWNGTLMLPASIFEFVTRDPAMCQIELNFDHFGKVHLWLRVDTTATMLATVFYEGVYYVENGFLYIGRDWDQPMTKIPMTLSNPDPYGSYQSLTLDCDIMEFCGDYAQHMDRNTTVDISGLELHRPER